MDIRCKDSLFVITHSTEHTYAYYSPYCLPLKENVAVEFCNILYKSNSKSKITFVKKRSRKSKRIVNK